MKPIEIVELIKKSNPNLLGKMPDARAANIIRAALGQLGKQIDATEEGAVKVPGFGNFNIKQVEREKDGVKKTVKVITFRVVEQKAKEDKPVVK